MHKKIVSNTIHLFSFVAAFSVPFFVHAEELNVPLEIAIGARTDVSGMIDYLIVLYEFIVGSIGVIAMVVIMYWGFRWVTAAGNQTIIGNAKEGVQNALFGLILALVSFSVLQFINPSLVISPEIDVPKVEFTESTATENFSAQDCSAVGVNFLQALPTELRQHVNFSGSSSPCLVGASYDALVAALTTLDDPSSPYYGMKLDISSAYRTSAQQQHLYNCYQAKLQSSSTTSGCPSYIDEYDIEFTCNSCNVAAQDGKSNHQTGYAIDVAWTPDAAIVTESEKYESLTGKRNNDWHDACAVNKKCSDEYRASLLAFDKLMQDSGFQRICIEWWHFETTDSTGSWCGVGEYK